MRKYLNRGLLYREFKNLVGFLILNCLYVYVAIIYPFLDEIKNIRDIRAERIIQSYDSGIYRFHDYFSNLSITNVVTIFMIIAIGTLVIGFDLMGRKYEVLSSMPYTKEEIIINKWFATLLVVIIPLSIGFLSVNLIYLGNRDVLRMYMTGKMIFTWGILNILVYIFVLTFIMFIQSLSGKNIVGGIVGGILLVFPIGMTMLIVEMSSVFLKDSKCIVFFNKVYYKIGNIIEEIPLMLSPVTYNTNKDFNGVNRMFPGTSMSIKARIIVLIIISIISFILMVYAFKKSPLERIGYIVIFKPIERVFKIGVSVCFGILGADIALNGIVSYYRLWGAYFNGKGKLIIVNEVYKNIDEYTKVVRKAEILTVLIAILCGCIAYLIINKIIEMNKK